MSKDKSQVAGWVNAYAEIAKAHTALQMKHFRLQAKFDKQEQLLHNAYAEISELTYDKDNI
tara:strand:- start:12615 stop:12797 length:183 start_codon:yes stop_codon:yes gene_type:complete